MDQNQSHHDTSSEITDLELTINLSYLNLNLTPPMTDADDLFYAIASNDVRRVSWALTLQPNFSPNPGQPSPLWTAIHKSTPEIVHVLLRSGRCDIHEQQRPSDFYPDYTCYDYDWDFRSFSDYAGYTFHSTLSLLHWAVMTRSLDKVRILLVHGADANSRDSRGNSVLQYAVESQQVVVAEELIYQGAMINVEMVKFPGNSVLHDAAFSGNKEMVKMMLQYGADPGKKNQRGQTPLHVVTSATLENKEVAEVLLRMGAPVNDITRRYYTPLHLAIKSKKIDTVELLLDYKADTAATTKRGEFPLLMAVKKGNFHLVQLLLSKKANPNQNTETGQTALQVACFYQLENIVSVLLEYGADADACNAESTHVLHYAVKANDLPIARLVLDKVSNVDARDSKNCTPMHLAVETGNEELVRLLLEKGADREATSDHGENALHFAAKAEVENIGLTKMLLKEGISVKDTDVWGYTPLHLACLKGREIMAKLFLKHGANINDKSKRNECPLHLSVKRGSAQMVEYLLLRGANVNQKSTYGETAIYTACRYESHEKIHILLEFGADINVLDEINETPFYWITYKYLDAGKAMIKHMAKLAINNRSVHEKDLQIIRESPRLHGFYEECLKEVMRMQMDKFYNNVSFFDVLVKSQCELVTLMKNKSFVRAFNGDVRSKDFPLYVADLMNKFSKSEGKRNVTDAAERSLNSVFLFHLPPTVIEKIVEYLNVEDLEIVI